MDEIGAIYFDTITIALPPEIEVIANVEPNFLLTSSVLTGEAFIYQWLLNGEAVLGANSDVHYPQEIGAYQVYIQDVNIMSADEAFVVFSELSINGVAGNSQVNGGESFSVDVQLQNFGMVETGALVMEVSTDNPYVNISNI